MSIRTITVDGRVAGYQAIAGAGGRGLSSYTPAGRPDALAAAAAKSAELVAKRTAELKQQRTDKLRGLRMCLRPSKREDSPPILYVEAQWQQGGKHRHRSFSTNRHGRLQAVVLAMRAIERGTDTIITMTPNEVADELTARLNSPTQEQK